MIPLLLLSSSLFVFYIFSENIRYAKLKEIVKAELRVYPVIMNRIIDAPEDALLSLDNLRSQIPLLRQYLNLPIDTRIAMLNLASLPKVELAYSQIFVLLQIMEPHLTSSGSIKDTLVFRNEIKEHAKMQKSFINQALESLEENQG